MKFRRNIPNLITCLNLFCGVLAVYFLYSGALLYAVLMTGMAAFFDFADGFVARLLHVKSDMGKQLDSLADVVSFGLVPGVAVFVLLGMSLKAWDYGLPGFTPFLGFVIPLFAAWRLAKFNIDPRQTQDFIGLPTPATGLLVMSLLPQISHFGLSPIFPFNDYLFFFIVHPAVLIVLTVTLCWLMVSEIRLFSLKFVAGGWKSNRLRWVFICVSLALGALFWFTAVPVIIFLYVIISLLFHHKNTIVHEIQSRN